MEPVPAFQQLALSLLLGLLVGLQRERTEPQMAGFRTFPLITGFGTICALLTEMYAYQWILAAGFAGIIAVIIVGAIPKLKQESPGAGVTTQVAILVMFAVGMLVVIGPWVVAIVITGVVAVLLHAKPQLHGLAAKMGDEDFRAIMQFVLITLIVLPVLQEYDKSYDPFTLLHQVFPAYEFPDFSVLNPFEIWLMVVLVVAISLGGYISYKLFGRTTGIALGGILGGTISSTATTVSYSRRTSATPSAAASAAMVIMIASTIMYIRILIEISVVAPKFLSVAAGPVLVMFAVSSLLAGVMWVSHRHESNEMPAQGNPTELKSALIFAAMYAGIILAIAVAKEFFKDKGMFIIAALSGMTDMDAITLSTARLVQSGRLEDPNVGWRLLIIAAMSNLVFKGGVVATIGHPGLLRKIVVLFGGAILAGMGVLIFWP